MDDTKWTTLLLAAVLLYVAMLLLKAEGWWLWGIGFVLVAIVASLVARVLR